eukprot:scaffold23259_cov160-Skeletonema_dohrnii-CCMP3373.AAC.1
MAQGPNAPQIGKNDVTIFFFSCCLSLTQPHKDGRTPAPVGVSLIESRLPRSTVMDTIFHGYVEVAALVPIGTNTPLIDHLLPLIWTRELPHQPRGRKQFPTPLTKYSTLTSAEVTKDASNQMGKKPRNKTNPHSFQPNNPTLPMKASGDKDMSQQTVQQLPRGENLKHSSLIPVCREGVFRCKDGGSVVLAMTRLPSQTSICAGGVSSKLPPPCPEFA